MDPDIRFDFSRFHPLDHRLGGRRCWRLPGGWRQHLWLWWYCGPTRDRLVRPWFRWVRCPRGRHEVQVWYFPNGTVSPRCAFCDYTRLPSEADLDNWPPFLGGRPL